MYLPIQPERLYEQIVSQIEARIVAGELIAGDQLPSENELAKQFAVRRTAVSEAIKALREKRLVQIRPGRGNLITNGMPDAMGHSPGHLMKFGSVNGFSSLAEVRKTLEPEIMDTALDNVDIFVEGDLDFHLALAEATQNPVIPVLVDSIIEEEIRVTETGHEMLTRFPADDLMVAGRRYFTSTAPLPETRTPEPDEQVAEIIAAMRG